MAHLLRYIQQLFASEPAPWLAPDAEAQVEPEHASRMMALSNTMESTQPTETFKDRRKPVAVHGG